MEKATAIDFNIITVSNYPERNEEEKPITALKSIAMSFLHLLEILTPVIKRIIKGVITPINPESQTGSIFIFNHYP